MFSDVTLTLYTRKIVKDNLSKYVSFEKDKENHINFERTFHIKQLRLKKKFRISK